MPRFPDDELPLPTRELRPTVFKPKEKHWKALLSYIESGGSSHAAAKASGMGAPYVLQLQRREWWQEQLRIAEFVPVDVAALGQEVAMKAGARALEKLSQEGELSPDAIAKLGNLGVKLMDTGRPDTAVNVTINALAQLDLRGLSPDQLRALADGNQGVDAADVLDAEYEEV